LAWHIDLNHHQSCDLCALIEGVRSGEAAIDKAGPGKRDEDCAEVIMSNAELGKAIDIKAVYQRASMPFHDCQDDIEDSQVLHTSDLGLTDGTLDPETEQRIKGHLIAGKISLPGGKTAIRRSTPPLCC
jgi:hypothetical protein